MSERIELRLERAAARGFCLGRDRGRIVFVPYTLPGETVSVELAEVRKDWARARLLEVLDPSPDRVEPACPFFGPEGCGGCHWQHAAYPAQLRIKREVVSEQLRRLGGSVEVEVGPCAAAGQPWGYRNHVQLRITRAGPGYVAAAGRRIETVSSCPVLHPLLADLFPRLKDLRSEGGRVSLRCGTGTGERMMILDGITPPPGWEGGPGVSVLESGGGRVRVLRGKRHYHERAAGFLFRISARGFFQVNTAGAEILVRRVLDALPPRIAGTALDLFGGAGLFGLPLAARAERVALMEAHSDSLADARSNARAAGAGNLEVLAGDAAALLKGFRGPVEAVVADPPRRGMGAAVISRIAALEPRHVLYVSCDPATLARDLKFFRGVGYGPVSVSPVDLFPQTFHVESVTHLVPLGENPE
jgi:23S rRNA (uracil1939-C5)-methyltransferase